MNCNLQWLILRSIKSLIVFVLNLSKFHNYKQKGHKTLGQGKYLQRGQVRVDRDQLFKNPPKVSTLEVKKCLKNPFRQAAVKLNPSREVTLFKKPKHLKVATFV